MFRVNARSCRLLTNDEAFQLVRGGAAFHIDISGIAERLRLQTLN
jgi:hypothetical protein